MIVSQPYDTDRVADVLHRVPLLAQDQRPVLRLEPQIAEKVARDQVAAMLEKIPVEAVAQPGQIHV